MIKSQMEKHLDGPTCKYAVFQVPFDNDLIRDIRFMEASEIEDVSDQYELVGTVDAVDLDQVFFFGNMQRSKFTLHGEMVSVSVGDIIDNITTGDTWVVETHGFTKITMKEAVE